MSTEMKVNETKGKTKWKWTWESGSKRKNGVFWGVILLCAAALMIISGLGLNAGGDLTWWRILGGAVCLGWMVERIVARQFADAVLPLGLLFVIFQPVLLKLGGRTEAKLINEWLIVGAAVLVMIALKIMLPSRKGKGKKMGASTVYLDAGDLSDAKIHDNLGRTEVFLTNTEAYPDDGTILICDNLGQVLVHVPSDWLLTVETQDNLGRVSVPERDRSVYSKALHLTVRDNLGEIEVIFD